MEMKNVGILRHCDESSVLLQSMKSIVYTSPENSDVNDKFLIQYGEKAHESLVSTHAEGSGPSEGSGEAARDINVLCRACANSNNHMVPIFEGEGAQLGLVTKIHKYLPIRLAEDDALPTQLCYHCAVTIIAFHDIVEGCLEAEQKLLQMQQDRIQKTSEEGEEAVAAEVREISKDSREMNIRVQEEKVVIEVLNDKTEENSQEMVSVKPAEPERSEDDEDTSSHPKFQKAVKEYLTASKLEASKPSESNVKTPALFKVPSQDHPSTPQETVPENSQEISPNKRKKETSALNLKSKSNTREKQSKPKSQQKSFTCQHCDRVFKVKAVYDCHLKEHEGQKSFTCHVCGKQFGQTGSLYYHLKHVHEGVKNHACDICGRCFAMKTAMQDHRRIHTGERPYICDTCGKTFKTTAALYIHSKIHSDQFPYKCSYCNKLFRFKQQMLGHLTTHTGIKNHTCDTCGKSFGVKWDLTRHLRIHSTEKPFVCDQCGMSFGQKRYLTSHERSKHKTE